MQSVDWEAVVFEHSQKEIPLEQNIKDALEQCSIAELYPMQIEACQHILHTARDVAVRAPTGSGKTLAYALPLALSLDASTPHVQAVVFVPTQALVSQVVEVLKRVLTPRGLCVVGLGTASFHNETDATAHVVVTKPGRMLHHATQNTIDTRWVTHIVLDETDRLLRIASLAPTLHLLRQAYRSGVFQLPIGRLEKVCIQESAPPHRVRLLLFSATLSSSPAAFRRLEMFHPLLLDFASSFVSKQSNTRCAVPTGVTHSVLVTSDKERSLVAALKTSGKTIVFCQTTSTTVVVGHLVRAMMDVLHEPQEHVGVSSGVLDEKEKLRVVRRLERGDVRVYVTTEEMARGMDFKTVETVINFDVPHNRNTYVHRAGRTGRAGKSGVCLTLALHNERTRIKAILKEIGVEWIKANETLSPEFCAEYEKVVAFLEEEPDFVVRKKARRF